MNEKFMELSKEKQVYIRRNIINEDDRNKSYDEGLWSGKRNL